MTGVGQALGLFHSPVWEPFPPRVVFGAAVAAREFVHALWRHCALDRCEVFVPPAWTAQAAVDIEGARATGTSRTNFRVHGYGRLIDGLDELGLTCWHDVHGDVIRPLRTRRQLANRCYPVTVTHHTLSYATMLYDWVLPPLELPRQSRAVCGRFSAKPSRMILSSARRGLHGRP